MDLEPFGFPNTLEQLWLRELPGEVFEVSCIPFRSYGLALGDVVGLREGKLVASVKARSGRRVFHVFFTEPRPPEGGIDSRALLREAIASEGFLSEWSGDRHIAIDVPADADPSGIYRAVEEEVHRGTAYWEWADAEPFRCKDARDARDVDNRSSLPLN
ncbi:DUF4265 domain-containing protein [Streptomyces morookaense]|uniref:DUF4265 domain-containing protein n=1 Tax=Streptomyces morookaense TaxID=1970 RepID=UPI00167D05C1|nr:DUF4265 domain-containing protein [Streptomyces morookaense]